MTKVYDRLEIEKIVSLYNNREFQKCLEIVKIMMDERQMTNPWLFWMRGVCEDVTGNLFAGLTNLKQALASDSLNYTYITAVSTNLSYFKDMLNDALDNSTSLKEIENVHHFLVAAGEFSSTHQYLVVKNYIKHESYISAEKVLQNYLMNNPNDEEALSLETLIDECKSHKQAA